ncbi:DUF2789 domain-containing protein [Ferrimonas marina]|uniref:DUF2789 domain-containing protein n=1 Tax=Ferrimonas marina TaxID=299255 RepID=A0A1M5YG18_9GAMM|nr:DUF2789 domain-containing protein [Ferrimonas marina]SHI10926.1 Protein of unknown function [Ferrimonas marina]
MDMTPKDLTHLFAQLGLDPESTAIDHFLSEHRLSPGQSLEEAPFWNDSQRAFLMEERHRDAEWTETIDILDTLLRG